MSASEPPEGGGGPAIASAAVIGGGPAGLTAAQVLGAAGVAVSVFDRGREFGGRSATRRSRSGVSFDHGAPCFTVSSPGFREVINGWREAGVVAPWEGRFLRADPGGQRDQSGGGATPAAADLPPVKWRPDPRERFVGVPAMSAIAGHLAGSDRLDERHPGVEIVELMGEPVGRGSAGPWVLRDAEGAEHGPFDAVVVAVAAPQAARLLGGSSPRLARLAERARPAGCFAVMLTFERPLGLAPVAADLAVGGEASVVEAVRLDRGPLAWVGRENGKPGRAADAETESWVLHARPTWSQTRLEGPAEDVIAPLKAAFEHLVGQPLPATVYEAAHRWKFAHCVKPLPDASFVSPKHRLAACGDWFGGPDGSGGLEAAVLSAQKAAAGLLACPVALPPTAG